MNDYERLTEKGFDFTSRFVATHLQSWPIAQALTRLAAYEDTGLSPGLCAELASISSERLLQLLEAEKDRRCVVCASRETAKRVAEEAFAEAFCDLAESPADAWLEKEMEHSTD